MNDVVAPVWNEPLINDETLNRGRPSALGMRRGVRNSSNSGKRDDDDDHHQLEIVDIGRTICRLTAVGLGIERGDARMELSG